MYHTSPSGISFTLARTVVHKRLVEINAKIQKLLRIVENDCLQNIWKSVPKRLVKINARNQKLLRIAENDCFTEYVYENQFWNYWVAFEFLNWFWPNLHGIVCKSCLLNSNWIEVRHEHDDCHRSIKIVRFTVWLSVLVVVYTSWMHLYGNYDGNFWFA